MTAMEAASMRQDRRTGRGARRARGCAGQAIVEFVVGLVAILAVTAALLQVIRLAREHADAMNRAREDAARNAMSDVYMAPVLPGPRYIRDWTAGPDGSDYSRDDVPVTASPDGVSSLIIARARPEELAEFIPDNELSAMADPAGVLPGIHLVRGGHQSEPVPLLPVVRRLLYNADSITMEGEAYLVWTKGIY